MKLLEHYIVLHNCLCLSLQNHNSLIPPYKTIYPQNNPFLFKIKNKSYSVRFKLRIQERVATTQVFFSKVLKSVI